MTGDQDIRDGGPISPGFVDLIARNGGSPDFVRRASAVARGEDDPDASRFPALDQWIGAASRIVPAAGLAAAVIAVLRHLAD
ncbi:hypothetical protein [Actinoplanes sp. RD1]|uniref:hypothetical protein n=1 Tax=Actinoplanes sp. RD1 TaxID=3064538 RepID=UPI0027407BB5|nr:hypothetical protein [Actinoplanes sp. RD1]